MKLRWILGVLAVLCWLSPKTSIAQTDSLAFGAYARLTKDTLSSAVFHGRGYVKDGHKMASYHIATEFYKLGLKTLFPAPGFYQSFTMSANVFPEVPVLAFDEDFLVPGRDFHPAPDCPPIHGTFDLIWIDSLSLSNDKAWKKLVKQDLSKSFLVMDVGSIKSKELQDAANNLRKNVFGAAGFIEPKSKLTWSVSQAPGKTPVIEVADSLIHSRYKQVRLRIQSVQMSDFNTVNVVGYVPGKRVRDTFIVVTGHFDHLGRLGNRIMYPGANDNASGIGHILALAKYFSQPENQPEYSIAFIAFGGEEAGLLGSLHYVRNPVIPLKRTRFLLNIDIMGSAEGITVVNATKHPEITGMLEQINTQDQRIGRIKRRGPAANSDHYFFSEMGVPAFFIYTEGKVKAYHDIYDRAEHVPMEKADDLHWLFVDFIKTLESPEWNPYLKQR